MQASRGVRLRGQSEPLTQRLNRLLNEYSDGLAVPKELIQNADDAGATEVTLIYDSRDHGSSSESLLDPRMAECQGSCLWAFNNASFTDEDFDNILRLSGATKEKVVSKVGKFGLGFNAVYNLTDVPFLLSRSRMLILDPHGERRDEGFLEAVYASLGQRDTGVEFDFAEDASTLQKYHDQFAPFKGVVGCQLPENSSSFSGTLFRFPLRTAAQAERSLISKNSYTQQQMQSLMQLAAAQAECLLLFTQSVKTLRFLHIAAGEQPSSAQLLFSANKQLQRYFSRHSLPVPQLPVEISDEDRNFCDQTASLKAADAFLRMTSQEQQQQQNVSTQLTLQMHMQFGEAAESVIGRSFSSSSVTWLMCSRIGRGDSLKMATEREDLVPVGGVAVLLSCSSDSSSQQLAVQSLSSSSSSSTQPQSLLYCFLPLPVENPFPVMINASFSLTSSRRHLNERTVDEKGDTWSLGDWNHALLQDTVCPAFVDAMLLLQQLDLSNPQQVQQLWPLQHFTQQKVWQPLVQQFTKKVLTDSSVNAFHTEEGWRSLCKSRLLHPEIEALGEIEAALKSLATSLLQHGEGLAAAGSDLRQAAQALDLSQCITSRQWTGESLLLDIIRNFSELWQLHDQFCSEFLHFLLQMLLHCNSSVSTVKKIVTNSVLSQSKSSACFPNSNNNLRTAAQLLDPNCLAAHLFEEDAAQFPRQDFCSAICLQSLRNLGLRQQLLIEEVCERASSLSQLQDLSKRQLRCVTLFEYISNNIGTFGSQLQQLKSIPFLPAMQQQQEQQQQQQQQLQWHSQQFDAAQLFAPNQLYCYTHCDVVCLNHLVIDSCVLSQVSQSQRVQLLQAIGVVCSVSDAVAWQQITHIRRIGCTDDEAQRLCSAAFRHLDDVMSKRTDSKQWADQLMSQAEYRDVIICNGHFAEPKQVSQDVNDLQRSPYLHVMPRNQDARSRRFLEAVGLKRRFAAADLAAALQQMQQNYQQQPLEDADLLFSIQLLERICSFKDGIKDTSGNLMAPDAAGILRPLEALCYNNVDWLQDEQPAQATYFCHKNVSRGLCEKLKMPTQREAMVADFCSPLPFGQHEELTTRLNNILTGYPFGIELFKELIQNADDASATQVHFLCDTRQLPTKKVFTDNWAHLQGPALLVVNDSTFSDADIEGIQRLGEGSKRTDSWKTGQYGIGFNCVYNITDVPAFLSDGSVLCVMDPHCNFMSNATRISPGGMFKDLHQSNICKTFADVFKAFEIDGVQQEGHTIFRLPLRTSKQADVSRICKQSVTHRSILSLFDKFQQELKHMLLFLNSVRKVTMSKVNDQGEVELIFEAEAKVDDEEGCSRFLSACNSASECLRNRSSFASQKVTTRLQLQDSSGSASNEQWHVSHMLQMPQLSNSQKLTHEFYNGDWRLLPRVGAAVRLGVTDLSKSESGRVYCLLPLPLRSELAITLNGQFVLDPSRRDLWRADMSNGTDAKTEWNSLLLCELLPQCMSHLLLHITNLIDEQQLDEFFRLLPNAAQMQGSWRTVACSFWNLVVKERLQLMPTMNEEQLRWLPLANSQQEVDGSSCFLISHQTDSQTFQELFASLQFPILHSNVTVATAIAESLKLSSANHFIPLLTPKIFANFLQGSVCRKNFASQLPQSIADTPLRDAQTVVFVLDFVLSDCANGQEALQRLSNSPLQLCAANYLRTFNIKRNRLFVTKYCDLFTEPNAAQCFTHPSLTENLRPRSKQLCLKAKLMVRFSLEKLRSMLSSYKPHGMPPTDLRWFSRVWDFVSEEVEDCNFSNAIQSIPDCKLLPVAQHWQDSSSDVTATAVLPVRELQYVYYAQSAHRTYSVNEGLHKALQHLQVPLLCINKAQLQNNAANLSHPASLLPLLHRHLSSLSSESLPAEHADAVCAFLQENWKRMNTQNDELINEIRKWPILVALDGTCRRLQSLTPCILPKDIPGAEMDKWNSTGSLFLMENYRLTQFHQWLQCQRMTKPDVLTRFILPAFDKFSSDTRITHLHLLKEMNLKSRNGSCKSHRNVSLQQLKQQLKQTRLVPQSEQQQWKLASQFFCDNVSIFTEFYDESHFLPEPFRSHEWQDLMQAAGLITQCDANELLRMAQTLQDCAIADLNETKRKSEIVIRYANTYEYVFHATVLQQLAQIKFIVPEVDTELQQLCGSHQSHQQLMSLRSCVLFKQRNICWTSASLAPSFIEELHAIKQHCQQQPAQQQFINHFFNIFRSAPFIAQRTDSDEADMEINQLRITVLQSVYNHMQCINCYNWNEISQMPVVLVNYNKCWYFLPPNRVCIEAIEQIPPWIVACPSEFLSCSQLLKSLGVTQVVSLQQIAFSLQQIAQSCSSLNETALQQVKRLVQLTVARLTQECTFTSGMQLMMPTKQVPNNCADTNSTLTLCNCTELILNDADGFCKRLSNEQLNGIRFLDLSFCKLDTDSERLLYHNLHSQLQVALLSERVRECLQSDCNQQCPDGDECKMQIRFSDRIHSDNTALFVTSIVIHKPKQQRKTGKVFKKVTKLLAECSVQCVPVLWTVLKFDDQKISSSQKRQSFFLDKKSIVMSHEMIPDNSMIGDDCNEMWKTQYCECVIKLIDSEFCLTQEQFNLLQTILRLNEDSNIIKCLSEKNVAMYNSGSEPITFADNSDSDLGLPLPFGVESQILQVPTAAQWHRIQPGSIVAVRNSESGQFVVAKVENVNRSAGFSEGMEWSWQFTVRVGTDRVETVAAARVFPFQQSSSSTNPDTEDLSSEQLQHQLQRLLQWTRSLPGDQRDAVMARVLRQSGDRFDAVSSAARNLGWQPTSFNEDAVRQEARVIYHMRKITLTEMHISYRTRTFYQFERSYSRGYSGGYSRGYSGVHVPVQNASQEVEVHPDLDEAGRFLRTSSRDLDAARDLIDKNQYNNWICYLCWQAVEKCLIAAVFASGANPHLREGLTANLMQLPNRELVQNLTAAVAAVTDVITDDCRYPTNASKPLIPCELFSQEKAQTAVSSAAAVLCAVTHFVQLRAGR